MVAGGADALRGDLACDRGVRLANREPFAPPISIDSSDLAVTGAGPDSLHTFASNDG